MISIWKASERGHLNHGWLDTWHTFSFGEFYDPQKMGFRALRVINEDYVEGGMGFGMHPHRDMEIITYVLEGALEHKDSMGNGEVLRPGEFQHMSAGTGIRHSEFNPSTKEKVHLYQIWLLPRTQGIKPTYAQKRFPEEGRNNQFQLVASLDGANDSLRIHQDARIYLANLSAASHEPLSLKIEPGHHAWLQVLRGKVTANGHSLRTSDAAAFSEETEIRLNANEDAEVMAFHLN